MQNRKYLQAKELFQFVYDGDRKNGDLWHAGRTLTGIGACNYSLFRYQESLHDWLEARQMSESVADWVNLGSLGVNISAMFLVMGGSRGRGGGSGTGND